MAQSQSLPQGIHPVQTEAEPDTFSRSDELLTITEVAAYLKISRRTAWRWCKSGHLPAVKVGHQWRVSRSALEEFVHQGGI